MSNITSIHRAVSDSQTLKASHSYSGTSSMLPHIIGMKSELIKYHALVKSIKPLDQRKDAKGKDMFVLCDWWRCNSADLSHFAFVLRGADKTHPTRARLRGPFACSMPLLERIRRVPSGTTLSWQCSLSTTNAMYESLGLCHCFLFAGLG